MPNGAELFVRAALQLGLDTWFTLVGDHLNEVLAEGARAGVRLIDMRHESGVTHAADAWARITRRPALALVTGGPGHTNALTGLATAYAAASPLILVSGSRASFQAGRQAFQELDQLGMVGPVVKWAATPPGAAQMPFFLARAYAEADGGRKGPTHLTIPVDLFTASGDAGPVAAPATAAPLPDGRAVEQAMDLLHAAERPVVIAGSGLWWSRAEDELRRFIEVTSLPLYTITMARGAVSDDHPLCMGYADPALNRAALRALQEADLVLAVGKRLDFRLAMGGSRLFAPGARFVQIDVHPQELGFNRKLDVAICADAGAALRSLREAAGAPWAPRPWLERVRRLRSEWRAHLASCEGDAPRFYFALAEALPPETLYSWDGGDFAHWGRAILPARHAGGWLRLGPLATIGAALPNAVALQLAHPGRPVALLTGDGALGFYIAEFDTAVRHKLPFLVIVGNDAGWGIERELQAAAIGSRDTVACDLRATRYDVVMQGFGGAGETVTRLEDLGGAVERGFAAGVPYLINVPIRGARSPFTEWQIAGKK